MGSGGRLKKRREGKSEVHGGKGRQVKGRKVKRTHWKKKAGEGNSGKGREVKRTYGEETEGEGKGGKGRVKMRKVRGGEGKEGT